MKTEETEETTEEEVKEESETEETVENQPISPVIEPMPEETLVEPVKEQKPSDLVKVKVLIGSMHFEQGLFQKGETFTVTRERASKFDPKDIQIVES